MNPVVVYNGSYLPSFSALRMLFCLFGLTLCSLFSLCASAVDQSARVLILGDSITSGYGLDNPSLAYPALLQAKADAAGISCHIVNSGISGDTTAGGRSRLRWAMGQGADVLIIALGGNDGLRGIPPTETRANLEAIIDQARELNPDIRILLTGMRMPPNMGKEFTEAFAATFPAVAQSRSVTLLPFLLQGVGGVGEYNQADRIHPNAQGQQRIANQLWPHLQKLLTKSSL